MADKIIKKQSTIADLGVREGLIKGKIESALSTLYSQDRILIENETHEQTITATLACYLKPLFPCRDVDVEYNREGGEGKSKKNEKGNLIKPDIIIHKREDNKHNLLVIEVKKASASTKEKSDHNKLRAYTKSTGLKYEYGLFLKIENKLAKVIKNLVWYQNGKKLPR